MNVTPAHVWRRVACLLVACAAGLACAVAARFGVQMESRSPLLWSAVAGAAAAAVGLVGMALAPGRIWDRWIASAARLHRQWQEAPGPVATTQGGRSLLIAAALAAGINGAVFLQQPDDPADDDQSAYLNGAREIRESGGVMALLPALFRGSYAEANRHPLFLALLSLQPRERAGRGIACASAVTALLAGTAWVARQYGIWPAGLFAILTATNSAWLFSASRVFCESLLILLSLLAWGVAGRLEGMIDLPAGGADPPAPQTGDEQDRGNRLVLGLLLGGLLGLTWLTKGTGLLLLAGCMAVLLLTAAGGRGWLSRFSLCMAVVSGFAVVGSPLLARNVVRYGSPFYNVNSQLLFVDDYEDPYRLAAERTTGAAARAYLQSHSPAQLLWREVHGLVWETYVLLRSLGPAPLDDGRILPGLLLAGCAVVGASLTPRFPWRVTLVWSGLLWFIFAWYTPIAVGERFLIPVLLPILISAALGGERVVRAAAKSGDRASRSLTTLGWLWAIAWTAATVWRG